MKDVVKKDLPEISGGEYSRDGCIPYPFPIGPDGDGYPRNPITTYDSSTLPDA